MKVPNRNILWACVFVDELARAGLRAACIAPGSRSTPLTIAFVEHAQITVYSHIDERSAGFFALGMARLSDQPVALVCTSGTAAANFHPAIIEACQSQVPLLVLTADRPHDQRDSGANQTIDQVKMYADHVRWFVDVAPPQADPPARTLRYLRTLAGRALSIAGGPLSGPVHLNFPFRKPLEPVPVPGDVPDSHGAPDGRREDVVLALHGRPNGVPFTRITRGTLAPSEDQVDLIAHAICAAPRGLIVCGPRRPKPADRFPQAVARLAQATGYPIFADALSGVRFGPHVADIEPLIVAGYESFLPSGVAASWPSPSLVLRFGGLPTSRALQEYLSSLPPCPQIAVEASGAWCDAGFSTSDYVWADPEATCRRVLDRLAAVALPRVDPEWIASLQWVERRSWEVVAATFERGFFDGAILADTVGLLPANAVLYVANSLPVRHLDQFARPRRAVLRVLANRGASGIDGTVSSALGAAAVADAPLVLVTGDLAFYHDLNGLLAVRRCGVKATIVVINNNGGGIFHRLPIAAFDPPFTDHFVTPHGLDFEPAARMYGADFVRVDDAAAFRRALQAAIRADNSWVIEVTSDREQNHQRYREFLGRVAGAITR